MTLRSPFTHRLVIGACASIASLAVAAPVDLSVSSIEVTQGYQNGVTTLVGGRATMVRVKVGISGGIVPVSGVDAVLRMVVNGVESSAGPFYSMNGPITAPLAPSSANLDQTLNFIVVPPVSSSVVFKVLVNPTASVVESSYANNLFTSGAFEFECRAIVELAYVPINYTLGGGLPPADFMAPGNADNFLRGIFAVGEWNYHRSPLGALTWTLNINSTASDVLTALMDIRNVQIPAAGYPKPEFVFGFLPGNPYSGNGLASGTPGTVAFGNTEPGRWQRTFAHEIGHLWGQPHNNQNIGLPSVDVEHHLNDPLGLPQLQASTQKDIMVAGLQTNQAWVTAVSYDDALNDSRAQCLSQDAPGGGGGGDNDAKNQMACLRVAGVLTHAGRSVSLGPVFRFASATPTPDDPQGDLAIEAIDGAGRVLHRVRLRTDTMRESCEGGGALNPTAPVYALIPIDPRGARIDRVVVRDLTARRGASPIIASRDRSATAPVAEIVSAWPAIAAPAPAGGAWNAPPVEVRWSAVDPDGDPLAFMLLYSPDGGDRWAPIVVNGDGDHIVFDPSNLPGAKPGQGRLRLLASDGFNTTEVDGAIESMFMGGNPPDVHILSPNAASYPRGASVVLHASGWDLEDERMPDEALAWSSSINGGLGAGRLFTTRSLSVGSHMITLFGTDTDNQISFKTIPVTITARSIPTPDINEDGFVNGADLAVILGNWGNFGVGDLNFDGVVDGADLAVLLGQWAP